MKYFDSLYVVRPESFKDFAVYKRIGDNRRDIVYRGTREECEAWKAGVLKAVTRFEDFAFRNLTFKEGNGTYAIGASIKNGSDIIRAYGAELTCGNDQDSFTDRLIADAIKNGFNPLTEVFELYFISYHPPVRGRFVPVEGETYRNSGGGSYKCLQNFTPFSVMQNTASGWTFEAHDMVLEKDGSISWGHSSEGYFEESEGMSRLQKHLIYKEMELQYAISDCRKHLNDRGFYSVPETTVVEMAKEYLENHDCNVADNDQWEALVKSYEGGVV